MMELTITSMTPADRLYAYNQSSQLEGQTGCIGHLRGDFGAGKEFYTSWFDHRREYKTDEFKAEFDEVVNTLREKDGLLCTRGSMTRFCYQNPELSLRETTAPSTVLRCRRPNTPICSGATPIMETTTFTSTPTLPDSWNTTWKRPNRHPVYHARLQGAVPHSRRRPHPHFHWRRRNPRPHLPVHRRNPF